jgi:hypothetical protein
MTFDPIGWAAESSTAAEFERRVLAFLGSSIGYEAAFVGLQGAVGTAVGLDAEQITRALRPGAPYPRELAPVKRAALGARGVAIDTQVLGTAAVRASAYFRHFAAPMNGTHTLVACFRLRGRVIGGLMLGRAGPCFGRQEVERVESWLDAFTIGRASFGVPGLVSAPLRGSSAGGRWPWRDRLLARVVSGKTEVVVRDRHGHREMVARDPVRGAEMIWSRASIEDPSRSGWPYVDLFHLAASLAHARERALFVGCGGAVGPRQFAVMYPGIQIDVVESDPAVVELARRFFGLDDIPHLAVHIDDGASFLGSAAPRAWDVVILDAYGAGDLGREFGARDFFAVVRSVLRPGGAMAFNVVGALDGTDPVAAVVRGAARHFDEVRVVPVMTPDETYAPSARRNVVVLTRRRSGAA